MKRLFTVCALCTLSLLTLFSLWQQNKQFLFTRQERFIPFVHSMAKSELKRSHRTISKQFARKTKWKKIQKLYDTHILRALPSKDLRIPKIIHHIALSETQDDTVKEKWLKLHPDWQYIIWTPEKISTLKLYKPERYQEAQSTQEKEEILRLEILYKFGGLCTESTIAPQRSFASLHHLCDFYAGLKGLKRNTLTPRLGTHLIGAAPRHPIIKECLKTQKLDASSNLTRAFLKQAKSSDHKNVALPSSYFYPRIKTERDAPEEALVRIAK